MTSKSAVSFDFWNTLYADGSKDRRMIRRKIIFKNYIKNVSAISDRDIDTAFNLSTQHFINEWKENSRTPTASERVELMARNLEIDMSGECIEEIAEEFGRLIHEIPPREITDAKAVVQSLAQEIPLGIISDTGYIAGRHIRQFLKHEGILECFSSFIFSDEQEYSKPHISVFKKTAEQLKAELTELIHVGDLERTDIEGAKLAGCRSIKFIGANKSAQPTSQAHLIVDSYTKLDSGLRKLLTNSDR